MNRHIALMLFKENPLKVFAMHDFTMSSGEIFRKKILDPLIESGEIEEVHAIYRIGKHASYKRIRGYKLLRKKRNENTKI